MASLLHLSRRFPGAVGFGSAFHQAQGYFPQTGAVNDLGAKRGRHHAINMPLNAGMDDAAYESLGGKKKVTAKPAERRANAMLDSLNTVDQEQTWKREAAVRAREKADAIRNHGKPRDTPERRRQAAAAHAEPAARAQCHYCCTTRVRALLRAGARRRPHQGPLVAQPPLLHRCSKWP